MKQAGLDQRDEARIIKMRNFNNFMKTLLINMYTKQGDRVFDMASGEKVFILELEIYHRKILKFVFRKGRRSE